MTHELGRGRFSRVVEDSGHAIKIIDIDDIISPHDPQAEILALNTLKHPNIITLLDTVHKNGIEPECQLVFPLYRFTLDHVLYAHSKALFPPGSGWRNKLELSDVSNIGTQLASALAYTHSKGIIHRDIKPENMLFKSDSDFTPILIDFGIAWVPGYGELPMVTDVSSGVYKAPEIVLGSNYTNAIDIWGLGCVLAKLLSPDSKDIFGEYQGDIALFGTQMAVLGTPVPEKCPSIADKVHGWIPNEDMSNKWDRLRGLKPILARMLDWEYTSRPSASEVHEMLSNS